MAIGAQAIAAGALVLASGLYALWRLLTPRSRIALLGWLAAAAPGRAGKWLARLRSDAAKRESGGCHSCAAGGVKQRPASARTRTPAAPRR